MAVTLDIHPSRNYTISKTEEGLGDPMVRKNFNSLPHFPSVITMSSIAISPWKLLLRTASI